MIRRLYKQRAHPPEIQLRLFPASTVCWPGTLAYKLYREGSQWAKTRYRAMKAAGFRCQRCGCLRDWHNPLDVHHTEKAYIDIPHERLCDLIVLCRECHIDLHDGKWAA